MATEGYIDLPVEGGGGSGVTSLNGETGALTLVAGSGITITPSGSDITIAATGSGAGTVTSVSVVTANGLAGTVANPTTTPALTLSTTITGILQGNGTAISAATTGNLTDAGTDGIVITGGTGAILGSGTSIAQHVADSTHNGYLSASDWIEFNNKLSPSFGNYITNPNAEVDTSGWNLYNNSGNTISASLINQDLTYTSALSGSGGNGVEIEYIYNASFPAATPNINVISSTHVQVQWNNGPTVANNPTATQLKAAWDAVPSALAIATVAITGTAGHLQYITGAEFLSGGGDASPTTGTGGVTSGVTFTRNTSTPLVGVASFDLGKTSSSEQGQGVSTDFVINALDLGQKLQISFAYEGSSGMVLGSNSDVQVFIYDIINAVLIPVTPLHTIAGPVSTIKTFTGVFTTASNSSDYRLILHIATTNATSWDLLLDSVTVNNEITPGIATQVPSLVLLNQPISGAVTDHMVVMWRDGATQWVPATIAGAALPAFGDDVTQLGFATNIVGSTASIYIRGYMDGFSFGPFAGYEQYIDNTAGMISPLPSPFNDMYVTVGMAISSTALNIQFNPHVDLISNGSGVPLKGGLLSNSAVNDGTGDQVLAVGGNGNVLVANSAASLGINWAPAVVASAPFTYTTATRTLTAATATNSVAGFLSAADHTTFAAKLTSPMTTLGDIIYENATPAAARLAGNTTAVKNFLTQTGNGTISAAPVWGTIASDDISNASGVTGTTVTDALNNLNQTVQEVLLVAIKNDGGALTANTTIPTWNTVSKDTLSGFNASTGVYTIPVTGDYLVDFTAAVIAGTPLAQIYQNGTLIQTGTGSLTRTNASTVITNCAINDTITVALDSSATLTATNTDTILSIQKLSGASSSIVNARYHSSSTTITSSLATITYTTKDFDTQSSAYSSGVYTIPSAGKYTVKASLSLTAATAAAGNNYDIIIRKNSSEISRFKYVVGAATQKPNTVVVEDLVSCATNDTIDIQASAAGTTPSINASTTLNFFYINKVSI